MNCCWFSTSIPAPALAVNVVATTAAGKVIPVLILILFFVFNHPKNGGADSLAEELWAIETFLNETEKCTTLKKHIREQP